MARRRREGPSLFDESARKGTADVIEREFTTEMEGAYLEYSMSVIVSRALPDVRDGLKPVQRRILWGMQDTGARAGTPHRKCAKVVGEVMGSYHPHGDAAIYDALVRMAQPHSYYVPLVDGQGNFGSPGYPPAAMRYTECRMAATAEHMLADIGEETVDVSPNYDGTSTEPTVLPAAFPNLLVNGAAGIAVGMATNVPSHNPVEAIDAALLVLDEPEAAVKRVMRKLKGPDFPSGCDILDAGGESGVIAAYTTGYGRVTLRATVGPPEDAGRGAARLRFRNLPPAVSVSAVCEQIVEQVKRGRLQSVSNAIDASDKTGQELQVVVKKGHSPQATVAELFKVTKLEDTFTLNMRALVDGVPRVLGVVEILRHFCEHRMDVVLRRSTYRRRKAQERRHIVVALIKALDAIDAVIAAIRASRDVAEAKERLIALLDIDDVQAQAIVDMQLRRLTSLETERLREELAELDAQIEALTRIIDDEAVRRGVVRDELSALRGEYKAMKRRCRLVTPDAESIDAAEVEAEAAPESDVDVQVRVLRGGWLEVTPLEGRRRAWRGDQNAAPLADLTLPLSGRVGFLTDDGRAWSVALLDCPQGRRLRLGDLCDTPADARAIHAFGLPLAGATEEGPLARSLLLATSDGKAKRLAPADAVASRRDGLLVVKLEEGARLVGAVFVTDADPVAFVTSGGHALRVVASDVPQQGRTAAGARAVKLAPGESLVAALGAPDEKMLVAATSGGWLASAALRDVKVHGRAGKGVAVCKVGPARGTVVAAVAAERRQPLYVVDEANKLHETTAGDVTRSVTGKHLTETVATIFVT